MTEEMNKVDKEEFIKLYKAITAVQEERSKQIRAKMEKLFKTIKVEEDIEINSLLNDIMCQLIFQHDDFKKDILKFPLGTSYSIREGKAHYRRHKGKTWHEICLFANYSRPAEFPEILELMDKIKAELGEDKQIGVEHIEIPLSPGITLSYIDGWRGLRENITVKIIRSDSRISGGNLNCIANEGDFSALEVIDDDRIYKVVLEAVNMLELNFQKAQDKMQAIRNRVVELAKQADLYKYAVVRGI